MTKNAVFSIFNKVHTREKIRKTGKGKETPFLFLFFFLFCYNTY